MPHITIPDTDQTYSMISFDKRGRERDDDPDAGDGKFSEVLLRTVASEPITDLFIFSHGWKGDIPKAQEHYARWLTAQVGQAADLEELARRSPGFRPFRIGLHWPAQWWGDEDWDEGDFAAQAAMPVELLVDAYVDCLGDDPRIRAALRTIFEVARDNAAATALPPAARDAYRDLNAALDLGAGGVGASPDADREAFDPDAAFELGEDEAVNFGDFGLGGILSPLRQLSFWTMKKRARSVGEQEMHAFLAKIQGATAARIHLMGHSFGCIVVSAMLGGPDGNGPLPRPVDSVVLVQGALSIWSYCPDIPHLPGKPGYFHRLVADGKVAGPIVTTQSVHDQAVGRWYPLAAGAWGPIDFGSEPPYGALGAFGVRGLTEGVVDQPMLATADAYGFQARTIYNLEASDYIRNGGGFSGAHSDIAGPEVAHAILQAALPREGTNG